MNMLRSISGIALLATLFVADSVQADWPLFHGNSARTGLSTEITTAGLVDLWTVDLGSAIYTSPVVADGRVYISTADARLIALNANTGSILWQQTLGSWTESTPAVAGGRIYLGCNDHKVYCFDALTGSLLWLATTASWVESSPLVFNNQVYMGGMDHHLYAYQALTGNLNFAIPTDGDMLTAPSTDGTNVFFSGDDEKIHAITPSGSPVWTTIADGAVYGAPVAAEGKIIYGSVANGQGIAINRLKALNANTGASIWQHDFAEYDFLYDTPAVGYGHVYVGGFQGAVYAFDLYNGELIWTRSLGDWALLSSPVLANGVLYLGSNEGRLYALDAFSGAVLDYAETGGFVQSSAAAADGLLLVGSADGRLRAYDVTAPVSVAATPGVTTVPPGGTLQFEVIFSELAGQNQSFQGWLKITRPTGQQINYGNPVPFNLTPGQVLNVQARLNVPLNAPPGEYILAVNAGPTPVELWDAASFNFTVSGQGEQAGGEGDWSWNLESQESLTTHSPQRPEEFALEGPLPNPFNPATSLRVALPEATDASLRVYDASGRLVATLLEGSAAAGVHTLIWDGTGLASGVYFFRLQAYGQVVVQRGVLAK